MGLFDFLRKSEKEEASEEFIASRKPVARFKVEEVMNVLGREALIGTVEGVIYPGYKVKGKGIALIRKIQMGRKKVDFAVDGDRIALILEGRTNAKKGETLEIYRS